MYLGVCVIRSNYTHQITTFAPIRLVFTPLSCVCHSHLPSMVIARYFITSTKVLSSHATLCELYNYIIGCYPYIYIIKIY